MALRRRAAGTRKPRPIDARSLGEALSYPGIDPRTWLSYGTVDEDGVAFDEDMGPLVPVTLQPSQTQVMCAVGSMVAGDLEGEYTPFIEGDTVLVAIPHGMERGTPAIIARFNNARAKFPDQAASQDTTKNALSFRRVRSPHVDEYGARYTLRHAVAESLIGLDDDGTITIRDGSKGAIQMTSDAFGYQSGDAKFVLQFDYIGKRLTLQVDDTLLLLSAGGAVPRVSSLSTPTPFLLSTGSNPAAEHATSTEASTNVLFQALKLYQTAVEQALNSFGSSIPATLAVTGTANLSTGAVTGTAVTAPITTAWTTTMTAITTITNTLNALVAGGVSQAAVTPQDAAIAAAIFSAFAAAQQKPAGVPAQGQLQPGIGCKALFIG